MDLATLKLQTTVSKSGLSGVAKSGEEMEARGLENSLEKLCPKG